jgi:hypothetical protein
MGGVFTTPDITPIVSKLEQVIRLRNLQYDEIKKHQIYFVSIQKNTCSADVHKSATIYKHRSLIASIRIDRIASELRLIQIESNNGEKLTVCHNKKLDELYSELKLEIWFLDIFPLEYDKIQEATVIE